MTFNKSVLKYEYLMIYPFFRIVCDFTTIGEIATFPSFSTAKEGKGLSTRLARLSRVA